MKKTCYALALALALCAGCTTVVTPAGDKTTYINSPWGVVNNTVYDLDVIQDGAKIARLTPGQSMMIPPAFWREYSLVSVSAYTGGKFAGANSYTFSRLAPAYNWQIDQVQQPGGAP
ncbi:MAG: hypothetical protein ACOYB3_01525 [Azonexus sp.]